MADHRREDDFEEDSQFKKELEKLKELAENGMELTDELRDFKNSTDPIQIAFFDQVIAFENALNRLDAHPLRDMLGNPVFPKVGNLSDDELACELAKVNEMLISNRIFLEIIYPTDSREIYRFITEELLDSTNGYIILSDMSFNFTYEEFYPNHPENIKDQVEAIVEAIAQKDFNEFTCRRRSAILFKKELHDEYLFMSEINQHLEIFDELVDPKIEFIEVEMGEGIAMAQCVFTLTHETSNGEKVFITGNAKFEFEFLQYFYALASISIPEMGM